MFSSGIKAGGAAGAEEETKARGLFIRPALRW